MLYKLWSAPFKCVITVVQGHIIMHEHSIRDIRCSSATSIVAALYTYPVDVPRGVCVL